MVAINYLNSMMGNKLKKNQTYVVIPSYIEPKIKAYIALKYGLTPFKGDKILY